MKKEKKLTPLMQQYFDIKAQHPETLLFFQVGDFYELFFEDAVTAAGFLAIALTKRGKNNGEDIPLCGVPLHALNHYLVKLIKGGFKVAICDQITQPQPGKVVERAVTRVLTPGTLTDAAMLDEQSASYLCVVYPGKKSWGLLFSELLTAQIFATTIPAGELRMLEAEVIRFMPDEVVVPPLKKTDPLAGYFKQMGYVVSFVETEPPVLSDLPLRLRPGATPDSQSHRPAKLERSLVDTSVSDGHSGRMGKSYRRGWANTQFPHLTQQLQDNESLAGAFNLFHAYIEKNQSESLQQFKQAHVYDTHDYLVLDAATQKNLELVKNVHEGTRKHTLLSVLDGAKTAMGSRTIKKWLLRPLVQKKAIEQRHDFVQALVDDISLQQQLAEQLTQLSDLERIAGRIGIARATHHDYLALKNSLERVPDIRMLLEKITACSLVQVMQSKLVDFSPLTQLLDASLHDEPGGAHIIKKGFDKQLDEVRDLANNGRNAILAFEKREVERTTITSLKVGYNQVSGYYIEVTNPNLSKVPDDYIQYQKLSNRQRYVTDELKTLEQKLVAAQTQTSAIEKQVYERVKNEVLSYISQLRHCAQTLAYLDGLYGFANVAYENNYVRPTMDGEVIKVEKGRHAVVEKTLSEKFIANDTDLGGASRLWVITGPNMGGKSTYLRQVALMTIMAQCGSFVPAAAATLPMTDRVFTRIGAGDNVAQGKSTFLVEMEEAAVICTQATKNSLVILDEVGRGTSTYDGMALAQSIIEYLYEHLHARALFATHYHELTQLASTHAGIKNYFMRSKKTDDGILFLHVLAAGVAHASFGLEVAKLAKLPEAVVKRAGEILKGLSFDTMRSAHHSGRAGKEEQKSDGSFVPSVLLSEAKKDVSRETSKLEQKITNLQNQLKEKERQLAALENVQLDELSPKKAFDLVWELRGGVK